MCNTCSYSIQQSTEFLLLNFIKMFIASTSYSLDNVMKNFSIYFFTPKEVSRTVKIIPSLPSPSSSRCKSAEYRICHFQICAKIKSCCGQTLDLHTYHIKLARLIRDVFSFDIYHTFRPKFPAPASLIGEERMGDTTMPRCLVELETNIRKVRSFRITDKARV